MFTSRSVANQRILITGAANGIGKDLALRLYELGAKLALMDIDPVELAKVSESCGNAPFRVCDVSDKVATLVQVRHLAERLGGYDVIVANPGIALFIRPFSVNVFGTYYTVNSAMPYLASGGYILVTSSLAAVVNLPLRVAPNSSTAAIEIYANSLRVDVEYKGTGISVGAADYAELDTDMTEGFESLAARLLLSKRFLRLLHRVAPVNPAINALVCGIECRSAVVVSPRRMRMIRLFRAPIQ